MLKKTRAAAVAAFAVTGAFMMGSPASAQDQEVGVLNDVNVNALNIQQCNSAINALIAIPIEALSPEKIDDCTNAPLTDVERKSGEKKGKGGGDQEVGVLNDLNVNALNIQQCNSAINVLAIPIELLSPEQIDDCTNSALTDVEKR